MRARIAAVAAVALLAGGAPARAALIPPPPIPIPSVAVPAPPPAYIGAPAAPRPVRGVASVPRNPFMAANGRSEIHDNAWQTDAYTWSGPLGRSPQTISSLINRDCGSITFDRLGRVISVCVGAPGPELYMFDPHTLATLAMFMLPPRQSVPGNIFQDFTGGGYFYLDSRDRVVTATTTRHIYVIAETPGAPGFTLVRDYDLTPFLTTGERIVSALPDEHGLLWFVAQQDGVVGTLNLQSGAIRVIRLGHGTDGEITKSLGTDAHDGVYIDTNRRLYRFTAGRHGAPAVSWQIAYPNSFEHKPGQLDDGTGTTPVISGAYVAINDNADPMDVMIYRTAVHPTRLVRVHGHRRRVRLSRTVCRMPVFNRGASADENAMITAGRSYVIENNYGYNDPTSVSGGKLTAPGFARVDVNRNGIGCRLVWTNHTERAPSVVSQLSIANGLIYTYTKDPGSGDPWYWTAIDFQTGRTVYKVLAGTGSFGYNNNYAGIAIAPTGTAYLGTLGGIVAMRDGG